MLASDAIGVAKFGQESCGAAPCGIEPRVIDQQHDNNLHLQKPGKSISKQSATCRRSAASEVAGHVSSGRNPRLSHAVAPRLIPRVRLRVQVRVARGVLAPILNRIFTATKRVRAGVTEVTPTLRSLSP